MDALAEKLDARLREWRPETAAKARQRIAEVIELADAGVLDIAKYRALECSICWMRNLQKVTVAKSRSPHRVPPEKANGLARL
jgi:hypothetical protein